MTETFRPEGSAALRDAVAAAVADRRTLAIRGADSTRLDLSADRTLELSGHAGVVDYDPEELVVTLRSGTPLADVETLLSQRQQMLAFDPVDPGLICRGEAADATIGGVVATGNSGPRRVSAGAARDHVLGFTAVNGHGEAFRAGGRVVKNVTGFDLPKLFTGSWGTLGVFDTVTLRVLPAPRFEATLAIPGDVVQAGVAMVAALRHPAALSCAAWAEGRTHLRLEGFRASVDARFDALARSLGRDDWERIDGPASHAVWRSIAEVRALPRDGELWRIALPTTQGAGFAAAMVAHGARTVVDWGGARVWLALPDGTADRAEHIYALAQAAGGHARQLRGCPVSPPPPGPAMAMLHGRLRDAFDPWRLFNPGLDPWER